MASRNNYENYLRNCTQSKNPEKDWGFASASEANLIDDRTPENSESDLREGPSVTIMMRHLYRII